MGLGLGFGFCRGFIAGTSGRSLVYEVYWGPGAGMGCNLTMAGAVGKSKVELDTVGCREI